MALAVAYQTVASVTNTAGTVYTIPNSTTAAYGVYARDLVVTNSGANTIFIGLGTSNVATSVASFGIPSGGSVLLTECQVIAGQPLTAICGLSAGSQISVGFASVVSVI